MKTFKFSLVLRSRENTDVSITLDENIYGIHSKRVNILYVSIESEFAYDVGRVTLPTVSGRLLSTATTSRIGRCVTDESRRRQ